MQIKDLIKKRREELGLTYEALGNIVGVGKSTVRKWETGLIENMRRDNIIALSKALDISPSVLMGWEEPEKILKVESNKLSEKEESLLSDFNELNDFGKNKVINYTKDLKELPKYKKESTIDKVPEKITYLWEEPGKEHLMPVACHDDNLSDEEKEQMNQIINEVLSKLK